MALSFQWYGSFPLNKINADAITHRLDFLLENGASRPTRPVQLSVSLVGVSVAAIETPNTFWYSLFNKAFKVEWVSYGILSN
ncbi:hypothetical protein AAVH_32681 [Aphelenchoides avenae]|nr:hypothetical protein AAVH_32681 [Aphelenchus avenae]